MGYIYPATAAFQKKNSCPEFYLLSTWSANSLPFRCSIVKSILDWIVLFASIVVSGFLVVWLGMIGYETENTGKAWKGKLARAVSQILLIFMLVIGPLLMGFGTNGDPMLLFLRVVAFIFGLIAVVIRILRQVNDLTPGGILKEIKGGTSVLSEFQLKQASALKIKTMQKNAMDVFTVIDKSSVIKAHFGQALSNYDHLKRKTESTGGIVWGWKRYQSREVFAKDGLWFSARFLASNAAQFILTFFILTLGVYFSWIAHTTWMPQSEIDLQVMNQIEFMLNAAADQSVVQNSVDLLMNVAMDFLIKFLALFDGAGIFQFDCLRFGSYLIDLCEDNTNGTLADFACNLFIDPANICDALEEMYRPKPLAVVQQRTAAYLTEMVPAPVFSSSALREPFIRIVSNAASDNIVSKVNKLYPRERYMVVAPLIIFTIVAVAASFALAVVVIPSITTTMLKLRSGVIPTFTDPKTFVNYRYQMDSITYISGFLFWGNLAASVLVGALTGGFVFLCIWQVTIPWIQKLFAILIGVGVIVGVRALLSMTCRKSFYRGFYRVRPLPANLSALLNGKCSNAVVRNYYLLNWRF